MASYVLRPDSHGVSRLHLAVNIRRSRTTVETRQRLLWNTHLAQNGRCKVAFLVSGAVSSSETDQKIREHRLSASGLCWRLKMDEHEPLFRISASSERVLQQLRPRPQTRLLSEQTLNMAPKSSGVLICLFSQSATSGSAHIV